MSKHILIVEDEVTLRNQVAEMLRLEEFEVSEAENGEMALYKLGENDIDLILCDVAMPAMDGFELIERIREDERYVQMPFIFLTARTDRQFMRHGMNLGADDYLTKPFTRKELLAAIESRMQRASALSKTRDDGLEEAKKRLTHMVAHELRTPLISMTMVQEVISNKLDDLSPNDIRDLFEMMQSGNKRMRHVVEQMVVFTRLTAGELTKETIAEKGMLLELDFVIQEAISQARGFAYKNQNGQVNRPAKKPYAPLRCDLKPLAFGFAEIIANALIYSPPNTSIIIQERVEDPWIILTITDSGPGMTTNRLQIASMPFEQIDRESQEQQGMGLGIPIAMKIIEVHRGTLDIQQTASGGTKVTIKLPLATR